MGYMHIISLYKWPEFFKAFPQVYAMEKIHGTSTWITLTTSNELIFHSGGEPTDKFTALFDKDKLYTSLLKLKTENNWSIVKIHGEAYGGKQQGMSKTYGPKLKFIVFEVCHDGQFVDVPAAEGIAKQLDLEFVHYEIGANTAEWVEAQSNLDSVQAVRNGMGAHPREGVVIRPLTESTLLFHKEHVRAIAKHKNANFWEIKTRKPLGERLEVMSDINTIVDEWVTDERIKHVIDRVLQAKEDKKLTHKDTPTFINLMVEDVKREGEGEIEWSDNLAKGIRRQAGTMYQSHMKKLSSNVMEVSSNDTSSKETEITSE